MMVDFHSHCLPSMDDGAVDAAESAAMLEASAQQGVTTVVATPHFYRSEENIASFLTRRTQAAQKMVDCIPEDMTVLLGAEVLLQKGLSRLNLAPLCIEGTRRILIELPFVQPEDWIFEEMENIALAQRLDVILAHVDRYMPWYSTKEMADMIDFPGLSVQLNAEAFLDAKTFRALRKWLPQPTRLVLGSDMHHADTRKPNLGPAYRKLQKKMIGRRWFAQVESDSEQLLTIAQNELFVEGLF